MPAQSRRRGSHQEKARRKPSALFATPPHRFKAGDRVRCKTGPAKGQLGTVVLRRYGGRASIHADPDQLWVLFDEAGAVLKARRGAIEKVKA